MYVLYIFGTSSSQRILRKSRNSPIADCQKVHRLIKTAVRKETTLNPKCVRMVEINLHGIGEQYKMMYSDGMLSSRVSFLDAS